MQVVLTGAVSPGQFAYFPIDSRWIVGSAHPTNWFTARGEVTGNDLAAVPYCVLCNSAVLHYRIDSVPCERDID